MSTFKSDSEVCLHADSIFQGSQLSKVRCLLKVWEQVPSLPPAYTQGWCYIPEDCICSIVSASTLGISYSNLPDYHVDNYYHGDIPM